MNGLVPLIEQFRGSTLENVHLGAVAVCDTQGQVIAHAGDPHRTAMTRSTLKALQALPFVRGGGPQLFGFTRAQLALMCASHSGEPVHVQEVQGMLDKAGITVRALQCGCHVPYYVDPAAGPLPVPGGFDERHNNCSGKHAGFLAYCVQHGLPLGNYLAPGHPLQQAIRRDVAAAVGLGPEHLALGVDGCSAPNYAMPLSALARGYARLATGLGDGEFGEAFAQLADAMTAHPDLVSGTGRSDLAYMRAGRGDWVTKAGAEGMQVVASRSRGQAFALKIADGNKLAAQAATIAVLDQLGWMDARQRDELRPLRVEAIANLRGTQVGERRAVLRLQGAAG